MALIDSWSEGKALESGTTTTTFAFPRDVPTGSTVIMGIGRGSSTYVTSVTPVRGNPWVIRSFINNGSNLTSSLVTMKVTTPIQSGDVFTVTAGANSNRWVACVGVFNDLVGDPEIATPVSGSESYASIGPFTHEFDEVLIVQFVCTSLNGYPYVAFGNTIASEDTAEGSSANRAAALLYKYEGGNTHTSRVNFASSVVFGSVGLSYATVTDVPEEPAEYLITIWDGSVEIPVEVSVWDGVSESPAAIQST